MLFIHHSTPKKQATSAFIVLVLLFSMGCFHEFYKVERTSLNNFKETVNTEKVEKPDYYIVHYQDKAMHLSDLFFQDGNLHGTLSELPFHRNRDPINPVKPVRYRPQEKYVLEEVHLVLNEDVLIDFEPGEFTVPDLGISEIHVYDKDNGATISHHIGSLLGFSLTGIMVMSADWEHFGDVPSFGNVESCPFVYANNGHTFQLQGEVFAGAIFPQLERHDYLALPNLKVVDNGYQIRIANEQAEYHHINLANLIVVEHPQDSKVLLDKNGIAHTISDPKVPKAAKAPSGKDLLPFVTQQDFNIYYYEEGDLLQNYVELNFEKPKAATNAKLLLNARSSYWSTIMFSSITEMLGNTYPQWVAQMSGLPIQQVHQMMDNQGLRLGIYLWSDGDWRLIDQIDQIGPVAFRDVIIPIDLNDHQGNEVRVKVEGGHLFWEMDFAAMDFTPDLQLKMEEYQPGYAKASDGKVYTKALGKDDRRYLELPADGQQVTIWYPAVTYQSGNQTSIFLHSKGYYEHLHEYDFAPDMVNFPQLDQPGTFIQYSKNRFETYVKTQSLQY